jgi:hypothetical protein
MRSQRRPFPGRHLNGATMKKTLIALASTTALALAGCGDTCSSSAAKLATTNSTCSLMPGSSATINVQLCANCTDSNPSCQAEMVGGHIELAPTVQQCSANQGCAINGCNTSAPTASCTIDVPSAPGSIPIVIVGDSTPVNATLNVGGTNTSCTL